MSNGIDSMKAYFPAVLKGCESASDKFFKCLNENLQPHGNEQIDSDGINQCQPLKINYEKCMDEKLQKNTLTARKDYNDYKMCMQSNRRSSNAKERCASDLDRAINTTTQIISRECLPHTEELYKCFKHSFRLSFCDNGVIERLKNCQSDIYKMITS
ncbi:hypothetical protein AK88_05289 [Plasmodium fragile]|uniref:Uncharacterized protein n=1 Tax=Plasmodium fragile TaxID=5857 RepID=A0A0D9QHA5_PLAFR|nr:uncharacterized protein AK88_05289 [Plasmodium fragile]KJP85081.1 hypothetical protein AK88_05289 [Plasmodium fragile]